MRCVPSHRRAARLLDDERERIRLVEQTQLALRRLAIRRIREDSAAEEVAMKVGDERADVARAQRPAIALEAVVLAHQRRGRLSSQSCSYESFTER